MAIISGTPPKWWDRDLDDSGKVIRADVRAAAHKIWSKALKRTQDALGDSWYAAELMEETVARISEYLDGRPQEPSAEEVSHLLLLAFSSRLWRYAERSRKLELAGCASELPDLAELPQWPDEISRKADLEKIHHRL